MPTTIQRRPGRPPSAKKLTTAQKSARAVAKLVKEGGRPYPLKLRAEDDANVRRIKQREGFKTDLEAIRFALKFTATRPGPTRVTPVDKP